MRRNGLFFFTRLKKNRQVNPDISGNVGVGTLEIPEDGLEVHLKNMGLLKFFIRLIQKEKTGIRPLTFYQWIILTERIYNLFAGQSKIIIEQSKKFVTLKNVRLENELLKKIILIAL